MNAKELLEKKLTDEEINEFLRELMGYSCNIPEDSSVPFRVFDEDGDLVDFRKYIGMRGLNTISGILLLKEKIDEERGVERGKNQIRIELHKAIGIHPY